MAPSCDLCTAPAHGIDHSWLLPLLPHLLPVEAGELALPVNSSRPGDPWGWAPLTAAAAGATRSTPAPAWLVGTPLPRLPRSPVFGPHLISGAACRVPVSLPAHPASAWGSQRLHPAGLPSASTEKAQQQALVWRESQLLPACARALEALGCWGGLCWKDLGTGARLAAEQGQCRLAAGAVPGGQSRARPVPVLVGTVKHQGWDLAGGAWDTRNPSDEE